MLVKEYNKVVFEKTSACCRYKRQPSCAAVDSLSVMRMFEMRFQSRFSLNQGHARSSAECELQISPPNSLRHAARLAIRAKRGNLQSDAGFRSSAQRGHRFTQECLWSPARHVNQGPKTESVSFSEVEEQSSEDACIW